jgi:tetratricopeptide (TPR) repeat protein
MAISIKGFRARRKAAKVAAENTPVIRSSAIVEEATLTQRLGAWVGENPKTIRNTLFGVVGAALIVVLFVVLRAAAKDEHSRKLHAALEKYEQIKILPRGEARTAQMKEFGTSLKDVCEQALATLESSAACFSGGNALLEGREFKLAAAFFGRAASGYDTDAMASVARFMQAQALEGGREFAQALDVYKQLEKDYAAAKKSELAIFHQGRMLYYLGKYDEAEEKFAKLSREGEGKEFAAPSRNYISILNAERAVQGKDVQKALPKSADIVPGTKK